jgi:LysM domain
MTFPKITSDKKISDVAPQITVTTENGETLEGRLKSTVVDVLRKGKLLVAEQSEADSKKRPETRLGIPQNTLIGLQNKQTGLVPDAWKINWQQVNGTGPAIENQSLLGSIIPSALAYSSASSKQVGLPDPETIPDLIRWENKHETVNIKVTLKQGDTLWDLAKIYRQPVADVLKLNPQIKDPTQLQIGDEVLIWHGTIDYVDPLTKQESQAELAEMKAKLTSSAIQPGDPEILAAMNIQEHLTQELSSLMNGTRSALPNGFANLMSSTVMIMDPKASDNDRIQGYCDFIRGVTEIVKGATVKNGQIWMGSAPAHFMTSPLLYLIRDSAWLVKAYQRYEESPKTEADKDQLIGQAIFAIGDVVRQPIPHINRISKHYFKKSINPTKAGGIYAFCGYLLDMGLEAFEAHREGKKANPNPLLIKAYHRNMVANGLGMVTTLPAAFISEGVIAANPVGAALVLGGFVANTVVGALSPSEKAVQKVLIAKGLSPELDPFQGTHDEATRRIYRSPFFGALADKIVFAKDRAVDNLGINNKSEHHDYEKYKILREVYAQARFEAYTDNLAYKLWTEEKENKAPTSQDKFNWEMTVSPGWSDAAVTEKLFSACSSISPDFVANQLAPTVAAKLVKLRTDASYAKKLEIAPKLEQFGSSQEMLDELSNVIKDSWERFKSSPKEFLRQNAIKHMQRPAEG